MEAVKDLATPVVRVPMSILVRAGRDVAGHPPFVTSAGEAHIDGRHVYLVKPRPDPRPKPEALPCELFAREAADGAEASNTPGIKLALARSGRLSGRLVLPDGRDQNPIVCVPPLAGPDESLLPMIPEDPERWSRMHGALGPREWERVVSRHVGLIGAGGLGSQLAVQLAADGLRRLLICDPDSFEASDFGRAPLEVGTDLLHVNKAVGVGQVLARRAAWTDVTALPERFERWDVYRRFRDVDVLFVVCDSAETRRLAGFLASRYLLPVISVGTGVFGGDEARIGLEVATVVPGDGCLSCVGHLDEEAAARADAESRFREGRRGSLRSANLAAIGLAMRSFEDLVAGRILSSRLIRGVWLGGQFRLESVPAAHQQCFCEYAGSGDEAE